MKISQRLILNIFFALFLVIILGATTLSYQQIDKVKNSNEWVKHTHQVLQYSNELLLDIYDLQTSVRGFLISGDREYIINYDSQDKEIMNDYNTLKDLTLDNPEQHALVIKLEPLLIECRRFYKEVIALKEHNKITPELLTTTFNRSQKLSTDIKNLKDLVNLNESKLLDQREADFLKNFNDNMYLTNSIYIIDVVILIILIFFFNKMISKSQLMRDKVEKSESLMKSIMNGSKDPISAIDSNYNYLAFNDAYYREFYKQFGRKVSVNKNVKKLLEHDPELRDKIVNNWRRALAGEQFTVVGDFGIFGKNANYEISYNPIYNENNELIGASNNVRNVSKIIQQEIHLKQMNKKLEVSLHDVENQAKDMMEINEMNSRVRSSISLEEALKIICLYLKKCLPFSSGIVYLLNNSKNYLEAKSEWNNPNGSEKIFSPVQCWCLRQGKTYFYLNPEENLPCLHMGSDVPPYICIPLMAMNEMVGTLYLEITNALNMNSLEIKELVEKHLFIIQNLSGQLALSISNIQLQELLKIRSTRDNLTKLHNRAYLNDTFDRELQRAKRKKAILSVVMMDIDHFKEVNDQHGHQAGDAVLKEISTACKEFLRDSDIVCRYGGEEILMILFDTAAQESFIRIEQLREHISKIKFNIVESFSISASFGIAEFPKDADSVETLIKAADTALYQSKHNGRNRTTIFTASDKQEK